MPLPEHIATFKQLGCCVLMPTYNNAGTLRKVILGVLEYSADVIVVNDGSTDATADILNDRLPRGGGGLRMGGLWRGLYQRHHCP